VKILVCGGRDFADKDFLFDWLDDYRSRCLDPITHLIHGAARGADTLAGEWAALRGIQPVACPALWRAHGSKAAGPMRNAAMLQLWPDIVIAFPGGTGTANMVRQSRQAGILVVPAVPR